MFNRLIFLLTWPFYLFHWVSSFLRENLCCFLNKLHSIKNKLKINSTFHLLLTYDFIINMHRYVKHDCVEDNSSILIGRFNNQDLHAHTSKEKKEKVAFHINAIILHMHFRTRDYSDVDWMLHVKILNRKYLSIWRWPEICIMVISVVLHRHSCW